MKVSECICYSSQYHLTFTDRGCCTLLPRPLPDGPGRWAPSTVNLEVNINFQVLTQKMRWPGGTYLNGLIALSWGLERNYRVYTNIHQLTAFLCGVERLQFARERSDKRSDQWGTETLLCLVWGVVGGAISQNEEGASFSVWGFRCLSPHKGPGSTHWCPLSVCD